MVNSIQNRFVAIRFRDALFYLENQKIFPLSTHYAVGTLSLTEKTHCVLSYSLKDEKPYRGLLIPAESFITPEPLLGDTQKKQLSILQKKRTQQSTHLSVGVTWKDVVYFSNGIVPKKPTEAYTEGTLIHCDNEKIVIEHPHTLLIGEKTKNHPAEEGASFLVIPLPLISNIETYDV